MKCANCGIESPREEFFRKVKRSFRNETRTLCPACNERGQLNELCWSFWIGAGAILFGLFAAWFAPQSQLGALIVNLAMLQVWVFLSTVAHELGHVVAARAMGFRVFAVEIGRGKVMREFRLWGLRWETRWLPFGGLTIAAPKDVAHYRIREFAFVLGGPLANLVLIGIAWLVTERFEAAAGSGFGSAIVPARMLLIANGVLIVGSLFPYLVETRYGKTGSDGLLLWQTCWRKREEIQQYPAFYYLMEAAECSRSRQHARAREWLDEGLLQFPRNIALEMSSALNLLDLKRHSEARRAFVQQLGRYSRHPEVRATLLNNIAWTNLFFPDRALLHEAGLCSREALGQMPWNHYFKGTRGSVLVEQGHYDEGVRLLQEAFAGSPEPASKALNACFLGIAEARLGHATESSAYFSLARRLDPGCVLLDRDLSPAEVPQGGSKS